VDRLRGRDVAEDRPILDIDCFSHCSSAHTGQVNSLSSVDSGCTPYGISTSLPWPSWSVFDVGSSMVMPRLPVQIFDAQRGQLRTAQPASEVDQQKRAVAAGGKRPFGLRDGLANRCYTPN
jgi:hypothetical protein